MSFLAWVPSLEIFWGPVMRTSEEIWTAASGFSCLLARLSWKQRSSDDNKCLQGCIADFLEERRYVTTPLSFMCVSLRFVQGGGSLQRHRAHAHLRLIEEYYRRTAEHARFQLEGGCTMISDWLRVRCRREGVNSIEVVSPTATKQNKCRHRSTTKRRYCSVEHACCGVGVLMFFIVVIGVAHYSR